MEKNPNVHTFVIRDSHYYISCVQALMLWLVREMDRAVTILIVDDRYHYGPQNYEYRYFFKYIAAIQEMGLSIEYLGHFISEFQKLCESTTMNIS